MIEDAAHAFGSYYQSKKVGSFGDISCFSFDGIKNITSGEGGCVVTDDEEVLQKLRDSRLLGVEKDTEKRFSGLRSWEFDVKSQGWRYHMSNLMASIGIEQLRRFDYLSKKRQEIAETYNKYFEGYPNVTTLPNDYSEIVPHIYVVILQKGINRKSVQDYLSSRGIQSGIHYYPNHKLTLFKETKEPLPVIESIYSRILTLPLHPDLTLNEVKTVCDELKICIDKSELDETIS